jgi:hypothetical protein
MKLWHGDLWIDLSNPELPYPTECVRWNGKEAGSHIINCGKGPARLIGILWLYGVYL